MRPFSELSVFVTITAYTLFYNLNYCNSEYMNSGQEYRTDSDGYLLGSGSRANRVYYKDNPSAWRNIPDLFGNEDIAEFCFSGIWVLYAMPNFVSTEQSDIKILSGRSQCIHLGKVGSIQPIGVQSMYDELDPGTSSTITLFPQPYFGGPGFSSDLDVYEALEPESAFTKSIVMFGNSDWQFELSTGESICFRVPVNSRKQICRVPNISKFIGKTQIRSIILGCSGHGNHVNVRHCIKFGVNSLGPVFPRLSSIESNDFSGNRIKRDTGLSEGTVLEPENRYKGNGNCTESTPYTTKEDLMKLIKIRLEHDFGAEEQLDWPSSKHLGNTEVLDHSFDIMIATCPAELVQTEYLQLIREFAIIRLDEEWTEDWNVVNEFEPDLLTLLRIGLSNCSKSLRYETTEPDGYYLNTTFTDPILAEYLKIRSPEAVKKRVGASTSVFVPEDPKAEIDVIAEAIWIVGNHVAGICHHLLHKVWPNFWTIYIRAFQDFYLIPLETAWKNPKARNHAYSFILGGYGVDRQYDRMSFCAAKVISLNPSLDAFIREFNEDIVPHDPK